MLHDEWRKSSYSGGSAGACVEARVAARSRGDWRKSSYSGVKGECVEARAAENTVLVRDTQNRELGHLAFSADAWRAFLAGVEEL